MSNLVFRDGKTVSDYGRPYVIAEVNSSHNGNVDIAKQMIDAAKEAGCDCVKFQSWSANTLYSRTYYESNPIAKRFIEKLSLSSEQLKRLADYCREKDIGFSSTPYSELEVDFLVEECSVPFIKISSMEVNNPEFLRYIGNKQIPIVLSTGMAEMSEIKNAISAIESTGNFQIVLLHCVSVYPAEVSTINLNNIIGLREYYPQYPIGFSDHTLGDTASIASVALGAAIIEKHLTLDSSKIGMDNQMAMEPNDLKLLVSKCRMINLALGTKDRVVLPIEYEQRQKMRRSIVAKHDMEIGYTIRKDDLDVKRPGTGLSPEKIEHVIGRTVKKRIIADTMINDCDLD